MSGNADILKAPFPYAGGKSRVADLVWSRLGDVSNFVEPFAGTLAVLLRRPAEHFRSGYRVETVNDLNSYIVNFWRAVTADPEKVAEYADWPVTEADLHARHKWLVRSAEVAAWRERMRTDPAAFDAKIAGWWCWGQCCWIGGAWCNDIRTDYGQSPYLSRAGYGTNAVGENPTDWQQVPKQSTADGVTGVHDTSHKRKMPNLGQECSTGGVGVNGVGGRPQLADAFDIGRGVNGGGTLSQQVPLLRGRPENSGTGVAAAGGVAESGTCSARRAWLVSWMTRLADRLRLVRIGPGCVIPIRP